MLTVTLLKTFILKQLHSVMLHTILQVCYFDPVSRSKTNEHRNKQYVLYLDVLFFTYAPLMIATSLPSLLMILMLSVTSALSRCCITDPL